MASLLLGNLSFCLNLSVFEYYCCSIVLLVEDHRSVATQSSANNGQWTADRPWVVAYRGHAETMTKLLNLFLFPIIDDQFHIYFIFKNAPTGWSYIMHAISFYLAIFPASPPWTAACANTLSWQSTQHTQISRVITHFLQNVGAPWSITGLDLTEHCGISLDVLHEPD